MNVQHCGFKKSFEWLNKGWFVFKGNAGGSLVLSIIFLLAILLLILIPLVGIFLLMLFLPLLLAGLFIIAHKALTHDFVQIEDMRLGFEDANLRLPLLWLGLTMLAGGSLLFITLYPLSVELWEMLYWPDEANIAKAMAEMASSSLLILFLQVGVVIVVIMCFFYATPLVLFEAQKPLDAISLSLLACLKNIVPLTVFALMMIVLGALAALAFGVGYLVLIPVLAGASYASFRDVFDDPVEPDDDLEDMVDMPSS